MFTSCIFSPHKDPTGGGTSPKPYPALTDPYNALYALKAAYENRDSVEIFAVYDSTYVGTSFDPATLNPLTFSRGDETRHVQALYTTTSITTVSFTLPPSLFRQRDFSDPAGWATISVQNMQIEINDTPTSWNLQPNGSWEFKFIPHAPDSTSPTDTTWKIVRWTELP